MSYKQYKIAGLDAYVLYENGRAKMIINNSKNAYSFVFRNGAKSVPIPNTVEEAEQSKLLVEHKSLDVHSKIIMFCNYYKEYTARISPDGKGLVYRITNAEKRALKGVVMTEPMLKAYFSIEEWWCKQKNVANYVANINNILFAAKMSVPGTANRRFPNEYNRTYESKLNVKEKPLYWAHLRSLGWRAVKDQLGKVVTWEKTAEQD